MKRRIWLVLLLVLIGGSAGAFYRNRPVKQADVRTAQVTRGDIVDVVAATGTVQAVTTVEVGTQVGGIVQELYADFNSIVRKGQVIARLDPTLLQTTIEQQRANVIRAEADLDRLRVSLADSTQKLDRARLLAGKQLLPQTDLEAAIVNVQSAEASIKSSEAALTQAKSQLNTAEVNRDHTVITAPIDGIVISRNVEPGQTVNAGMSAPTLFVLAADLTKMQVNANIDESDVGRMRPGQSVTFRVDAFPAETFTGEVQQVRLQPTTVQNVVTYQTIIEVPNPEMKLKPGMTANANIEVSRRSDVLRIPAAAARFRPSAEMFGSLNQDVPADLRGGAGPGRDAAGRTGNANGAVGTAGQVEAAPGAMPGRPAGTPSTGTRTPAGGAPLGALQAAGTRGRVWIYDSKQLKPVAVRLGVSDGTNTEVIGNNELTPGTEVVTSLILPTATTAKAGAGAAQSPLMGPQRGPGGFGGPGPGGGRGGF